MEDCSVNEIVISVIVRDTISVVSVIQQDSWEKYGTCDSKTTGSSCSEWGWTRGGERTGHYRQYQLLRLISVNLNKNGEMLTGHYRHVPSITRFISTKNLITKKQKMEKC